MLYLVVFAVIVLACLGIAAIIVRKFPQLTLIDADALPKEKNLLKKREIIHERVQRLLAEKKAALSALLAGPAEKTKNAFSSMSEKIVAIEKKLENKPMGPEDRIGRANQLVGEAVAAAERGDHAAAEKMLVEAITLDPKNDLAFREAADTYFELKEYDQSVETLRFLLRRLARRGCAHAKSAVQYVFGNGEVPEQVGECAAAEQHPTIVRDYVLVGTAALAGGEQALAKRAFEATVAFEPSNPRYLDLLLEACILEGDKPEAVAVFGKLQSANPENQKLTDFAVRIESLKANKRKRTKITSAER